jgi:hypothetical protein
VSVKQSSLIMYYVSIHIFAYHKKMDSRRKSIFCFVWKISTVQQQHAVLLLLLFFFVLYWKNEFSQPIRARNFIWEYFFSSDRWLNTAVSFDMYTQLEKVAGASLSRRQTIPDVTFPSHFLHSSFQRAKSNPSWIFINLKIIDIIITYNFIKKLGAVK